jgi:uncharacterized Zn finger protein
MDQDRIDYIVEQLEQYLPTSAQALLQELMEGLRKTPVVTEQKIKENLLNDVLGSKYKNYYKTKPEYSQHEKKYSWEHHSALSKAYHEKTRKKL